MKNTRGLSLVEVLIGITVAAVAGGLIINLLISSNSIFFNQSVKVSQGLSLNQASFEITDLIKSSSGVAAQYPVSGTAQYITDSDTLVIKLPALTASGNVIDSTYDYAVVTVDPQKPKILRMQIFPNASSSRQSVNKVLATSLNNIVFNYLDSGNGSTTPIQAARVGFTIKLLDNSAIQNNESSSSGVVNIKNI